MNSPIFRTCTILATLLGAALLSHCGKKPTAVAESLPFECSDIGWTMNYPSDWHVMSAAEIAEVEGKAQPVMEEVVGGELDMSHRNQLYLRKNRFNIFTSTMAGHDVAADGPYADTQTEIFNNLLETYRVAGLEVEHEYGSATIDGLDFKTLLVRIFKPGTKEVLIDQLMYDRIFENGQTLLMSITWNDDEERDIMDGMLTSSRFTVR